MRFTFRWKSEVFKSAWHKAFYQWIKHYKILFSVLFFLIICLGTYQWYRDLGHYEWSEDQKKTYLSQTITETTFQQDKYSDALGELNRLNGAHLSDVAPPRDLFQGKKKKQ